MTLAHVFGKALISGQIHTGHVMAVDGRVNRIVQNLPLIRPTIVAAVPRIFERVYNGIAANRLSTRPVHPHVVRVHIAATGRTGISCGLAMCGLPGRRSSLSRRRSATV
ncbi:hypothetical protein ACFC0D_03570 [Streptomyces sp. NPDC056222]|uniref:hypothetical protein n=1 Tax=Streptomyces sp. NPDC056222 TaxID=3345749 RepID=UPI0035D7B078